VVSLGNNVFESPCASGGSFIGRVSVADASLSLSLSLWDSCLLGHSSLRRGSALRLAGRKVRLGLSRAIGAFREVFSSGVAGCVAVVSGGVGSRLGTITLSLCAQALAHPNVGDLVGAW